MCIPKRIIGMEKKDISTVGRFTWPGLQTSTASPTTIGTVDLPNETPTMVSATVLSSRMSEIDMPNSVCRF